MVPDFLLAKGHKVRVFDNFSTGFHEFLASAKENENFELVEADLTNKEAITSAYEDVDFVFHLAANADVRFGLEHPAKDLEQNTIVN